MTTNPRPAPTSIRFTPAPLLKRIHKEINGYTLNKWICAAAFHFLTLTETERDMVIRDYAAMTAKGK